MASFKTEFTSVGAGEDEFTAVDGVVDIPDEEVAKFKDFIDAGQLVAFEKPAKKKDEKKDDKK